MERTVSSKTPDPCPHETKGKLLRPGMITYQRVVDRDGNVKFQEDHKLITLTGFCKPSGIHFQTNKGSVCYWTEGRIWVKEANEQHEATEKAAS